MTHSGVNRSNLALILGGALGGGALVLAVVLLLIPGGQRNPEPPAQKTEPQTVAQVGSLPGPPENPAPKSTAAENPGPAPQPSKPETPAVAPTNPTPKTEPPAKPEPNPKSTGSPRTEIPQEIEPLRVTKTPPREVPAQIAPASTVRVKKSTVQLRVTWASGNVGEGSGFFAVEPDIVLTNAHVLGMLTGTGSRPQRVDVIVSGGELDEKTYQATVLGADRDNDLALLRVQADQLPPPLQIDTAASLIELQKVYIFGFPLGSELGKNITVSESSVSSLRKDGSGTLNQIQVNGGIHPGNFGGPVVDARGVVIGIAVAGIRGTQIQFAIPADYAKLLSGGQPSGVV